LELFQGRKDILDAGCGSGDFIKLNPFSAKIIGRDVNKDNLNKLKKQGFNVDFGDLNRDLEFSENSFDAISCFHVLEHLTNPQNALSELYRVLKKKGILVIMVPYFSFRNFYNDYTHVRPYTSVSLFKILEDSGFSHIQIKKGPLLESQFINALFLLFPKTRLSIEKFLGKFFPSEIFAIAQK
jgi:ubiquinone/menaquinone biosynthesis C-methylase UbiE